MINPQWLRVRQWQPCRIELGAIIAVLGAKGEYNLCTAMLESEEIAKEIA
jgi:hypothetical protein